MDKRPHGVCAIFNNTNFTTENLGKRKGSEIDRDRLTTMFQHLQYKVEVYNDLTADQTLWRMNEISQRNHKDFDSFICCILTHGTDNDALYGSDGKDVSLRKVMSFFYGKNAKTLFGKPKIFFIQACRGDLEDLGFTSSSIAADSEGDDMVHFDSSDLPDTADFLIAFPTSSGFVSFRSHNEGTWYIKALCDQLTSCHNQYDLMTILTMVNGKVAARRTSEGYKQMPAPVTHLRKLVYIRT
ncbi:hypothetical protein LOD99_10595 [Oopsacas minuta]|uniref:Uncharacterized protein n=1 Tax=Oopsacas minuta TaxID=111878 RepID=A0AAV7KEJ4_9METZ|nr:hypothetical protein LOD99_10595 [Oopsacas minuta]